ncbi:MAG: LacI family transcriptional regulator [Fimbriimonadaceae bacterium]|nr:LacI family transcriptional regulator [Fimbriimonadaceae bacterium]
MRRYRKATIRDVAAEAKVSMTTVSHVVSGASGYSEATIAKVREAIAKLNYVPSFAAKGLRQAATQTIGVCATDPFHQDQMSESLFSRRLWRGILDEADECGYSIIHFPRKVREEAEPSFFLNGLLDGLIMTAVELDRRPALVAESGLPVVVVSPRFEVVPPLACVEADEDSAIRLGLERLWELGHRRIAHLSGPADTVIRDGVPVYLADGVASARKEAFANWMTQRGIDPAPMLLSAGAWRPGEGCPDLAEWLRRVRPTAVFAANDELAWGVIRAARSLGLEVPRDLSVIGIDDDIPDPSEPLRLTTIRIPVVEIGRTAMRTILAVLRGEDQPGRRTVLPVTDLLDRDTTAPAQIPSDSLRSLETERGTP